MSYPTGLSFQCEHCRLMTRLAIFGRSPTGFSGLCRRCQKRPDNQGTWVDRQAEFPHD